MHTIVEKLLEDVSFAAPQLDEDEIEIDRQYVKDKLEDVVQDKDLSKYIL